MHEWINASNNAIIGDGRKCRELLALLLRADSDHKTPTVKGVADTNIRAVAIAAVRAVEKIPPDPSQVRRRRFLVAIVFLPGRKPVPPTQETDR
jgi:hypothetical protein